MPIAFDLIDEATLAALHVAAEWSALILALALAGGVYVVGAISYRV
jgi:hypothetical protein